MFIEHNNPNEDSLDDLVLEAKQIDNIVENLTFDNAHLVAQHILKQNPEAAIALYNELDDLIYTTKKQHANT